MHGQDKAAGRLREISRMARCGREFFVSAYPSVVDPQVRVAFAFIGDEKNQLLADLQPWLPATPASAAPGHRSIAALVEKMYAGVRTNFRGQTPARVANALSFGEDQLLALVERAFEQERRPALKRLLKSHYSQLLICRQAMWRLNARQAA